MHTDAVHAMCTSPGLDHPVRTGPRRERWSAGTPARPRWATSGQAGMQVIGAPPGESDRSANSTSRSPRRDRGGNHAPPRRPCSRQGHPPGSRKVDSWPETPGHRVRAHGGPHRPHGACRAPLRPKIKGESRSATLPTITACPLRSHLTGGESGSEKPPCQAARQVPANTLVPLVPIARGRGHRVVSGGGPSSRFGCLPPRDGASYRLLSRKFESELCLTGITGLSPKHEPSLCGTARGSQAGLIRTGNHSHRTRSRGGTPARVG